MTGSSRERELIEELGARGFAAMRAPASGSSTERELPDVLAGRPIAVTEDVWAASELLAIEAKYRSNSPEYFSRDELTDLQTVAARFGAKPLIAVRWNANQSFAYGDTNWYVAPAPGVGVTKTKAKLDYDECTECWSTLDDLAYRAPFAESLTDNE